MPIRLLRTVAAALTALAAMPATASQAAAQTKLLDVPYVSQSVDLCGGAALAMVLRYWGDRNAVAEDFAPLVDPAVGGISTGRLVAAARARGWRAAPASRMEQSDLMDHVAHGRPPLVLIEERAGVLHYVVVVAVTEGTVLMHDPADGPFREMPLGEFTRRWNVTDRWMLLVLPDEGNGVTPARGGPAAAATDEKPCAEPLALGIAAARADRFADAERWLTDAAARCPSAGAPRVELAGLRVRQGRWPEALALAEEATRIDATDTHAWRIVAAARYQVGDLAGALDAMAVTGEASIDLVQVSGAGSTPHPVVVDATGLAPRQSLDGATFERARRRLAEMPIAERTRLGFRPAADGLTVDAVVAERDGWPRRWPSWAATAAGAVVTNTLQLDVAGIARSGEVWTGIWRWSNARPFGAVAVATPSPAGLPGTTTVEGAWEAESYAAGIAAPVASRHSRHRVAVGISDWATGTLRWKGGLAFDRFDDRRFGSAGAGLEWRRSDDRLAAGLTAAAWAAPGARSFGTVALDAAWRSRSLADARHWTMSAGVVTASSAAPLALWNGAGSGRAGRGLLRAHPLLEDDVISGAVFGRRLMHASVEIVQPMLTHPLARVAVVGFTDVARAHARGPGLDAVWHADVGAGVRLTGPPAVGSVDISAAYGLRDGQFSVAFAVRPPWPGFRRALDAR